MTPHVVAVVVSYDDDVGGISTKFESNTIKYMYCTYYT